MNEPLETLDISEWRGPFPPALRERATAALEAGKVLFLPRLAFRPMPDETGFLTGAAAGGARKNISLDPTTGRIGNVGQGDTARLSAMLDRFGREAAGLLRDLLEYGDALERARTSFRPVEIADRATSPRHDDRRLHIDAFPGRPLHGRRILRAFSNIAPDGASRAWRVGESFEDFARAFAPRARPARPGSGWLLEHLGITRGRRGAYDHLMLRLHDLAKLDAHWQANAPRADISFPAGSTWMCFTDQVLHAAMSGHCALEQTFHLPLTAMRHPQTAPLRVLERVTGRALV